MTFITGKPFPAAPFCRAWARRSRCRFSTRWCRRGACGSRTARAAALDRDAPRRASRWSHGAAGCNELRRDAAICGRRRRPGATFDLGADARSTRSSRIAKYLTIVSNTDVRERRGDHADGDRRRPLPLERGVPHAVAPEADRGLGHPRRRRRSIRSTRSAFGQDTPIPSMQLCIENVDQAGGCAYGYACVYTDSISWASPTEPLPVIRDPRVAFEKLFGVGGSTRRARARRRVDVAAFSTSSRARCRRLNKRLDAEDKRAHGRVSRRHSRGRAAHPADRGAQHRPASDARAAGAPAGVPDSFDEHVKLMFDLQALAFQADVTRVFSFKMGRDGSSRVYPESGIDQAASIRRRTTAASREGRQGVLVRSTSITSACCRTSSTS